MPPFTRPSHKARDHDGSLLVVCAACWRKNKSVGKLSDKLTALVRKHVFEEFYTKNNYHPKVICDGCRKTLSDIEKVMIYLKF